VRARTSLEPVIYGGGQERGLRAGTETGDLLDADSRQNLKRIAHEFEQELGYQFLIGIEPETMWLKLTEDGAELEGVTKPYCYHIHQFEELRPVLLDVVESLVGPEMIAASAYRLRPKIPGYGVIPWHQDSGFFEPYCDRALILTVWLPLVDAAPERGCLQFIPRVHRGDVYRHHHVPISEPWRTDARTLTIEPQSLPRAEAVTVPVRKGGLLLFPNRTPLPEIR